MLYTTITIAVVIASILLVGIVLIQNSKGGGLASGFQSQNQFLGVRKTTDFIEKATWVLIAAVVVLSIASAAFYPRFSSSEDSQLRSEVEDVMPSSSATDVQD